MRKLSRLLPLLIISMMVFMLVLPALAQEDGEAATIEEIKAMITDANLTSDELSSLITELEALRESAVAAEEEAAIAAAEEADAEAAALSAAAEAAAQAESAGVSIAVSTEENENGPLGLGVYFTILGLIAVVAIGGAMISRDMFSKQSQ